MCGQKLFTSLRDLHRNPTLTIFQNNCDSLPGAVCVNGIENQKSIYLIPGFQARIHSRDSHMRRSDVLAVEGEQGLLDSHENIVDCYDRRPFNALP